MIIAKNPLEEAVANLANALESNQSKLNRAMFGAQPRPIQDQILQNSYDNGIPVKKLSAMTGVPTSSVYSRITTK